MSDVSRSGSTGNAAANAHAGPPAQGDRGQQAAVGGHGFQQGVGAPPPAAAPAAHVNVAQGGLFDGARALPANNLDVDDSATDGSSSVISDDASSVDTVLIGYPGVEGTRGLTRVSTTRTRVELNDQGDISDDASSVDTVLIGYPGVEGTRGLTRVSTTRTRVELNDQGDISDDASSVDTVLIGYPGVEGTRGLTRVSTTRTRVELNDQDDISDVDSLVVLSDNEDDISDFDSLVELPDNEGEMIGAELPSVGNGGLPEDASVRRLGFEEYRRIDLEDGLRRNLPLSYADRVQELRGRPSTLTEVPIPESASETGDSSDGGAI